MRTFTLVGTCLSVLCAAPMALAEAPATQPAGRVQLLEVRSRVMHDASAQQDGAQTDDLADDQRGLRLMRVISRHAHSATTQPDADLSEQPQADTLAPAAPPQVAAIYEPFTIEGVGAGQGIAVRGGRVWIYGDAETGVIRACFLRHRGISGGKIYQLTRHGEDLLPHPTGLTFDDQFGTFIGSTVNRQGKIAHIDFAKLLADGNLDNAVLNVAQDDLATNGTRPCYVTLDGRTLVATADYGDVNNKVRLYDPAKLAMAARTSEPGVLVAEFSCGPWVQNLEWIESRGLLVLVQNQIEGLLWRVTFLDLASSVQAGEAAVVSIQDLRPLDELEGMAMLGEHMALFVSSAGEDNVVLAEVYLPDLIGGIDVLPTTLPADGE